MPDINQYRHRLPFAAGPIQFRPSGFHTRRLAARASGPSGQYFRDVGDILAVPEFSVASPFLGPWADPAFTCLRDSHYESIPQQLLPRLRADPIGSIRRLHDGWQVQFIVFPGYEYALEASSDLRHWEQVGTAFATNSVLQFTDFANADSPQRLYRLVLLR